MTDEPIAALARLRVQVLGPVRVTVDDTVAELGGSAQRVLAVLAATPGRVVSTSAIIEALWGDAPPAGAEGAVHSYVSRLRRAITATGVDAASVVVTRAPGYVLAVDAEAVDVTSFGRLFAEGRRALAATQPALATDRLRRALSIWRTDVAYDGVGEADFVDRERDRLTELRLDAVELRLIAELQAGEAIVVSELEALIETYPHRERIWSILLTALYREGRQADALAAFQRARKALGDDLGVEPGPELTATHHAVLNHDSSLQPDRPYTMELPHTLAHVGPVFVGREKELQSLAATLDEAACVGPRACWIVGPPGAGKTRLAAALAAVACARGARIDYVSGIAELKTVRAARGVLNLVIVDDLDAHGGAAIDRWLASVPDHPVLGLCLSSQRPATDDRRVIELQPLRPAAVAEILAAYLDGVDAQAAGADGLVPAAIHDSAFTAAVEHAVSRIATASARGVVAAFGAEHDHIVAAVETLQRARILRSRHHPTATAADSATAPYRGMARFERTDAGYFHGRERVVGEVVARLAGGDDGRLLALIGASGSGKSSVVRAGLLPLLAADVLPGASTWPILVTTPGRVAIDDVGDRLDTPAALLVVDQFEESFTALDEPTRTKLFDVLVEAVRRGHRVVITLRSDFFGECAQHREIAELVAANTMLLGPMSGPELRSAIQIPAQTVGLTFEPGLVDRIVADVGTAPGGLALLSTALRALWEGRLGRTLTIDAYNRTGGVAAAVERLGELAYERLDPKGQYAARRMLVRLADAADDGQVVRRRVTTTELHAAGGENAGRVLAALADRRLITVDDTSVEVAHEALLSHWPRLRAWLDEDSAGRSLRTRLTPAARDWQAADNDPHQLWRGAVLAAAADWAQTRADDVTPTEQAFIDASLDAQAADELHQRTVNRRLRILLAAAASALALALVGGFVAVVQRNQADAASTLADARRLGAQALTERDMRKAMLLAVAATKLDDSWQTRGALLSTLLRSPQLIAAGGESDGDRLLAMALSPDGTMVATASFAGRVHVYDAATLHQIAIFESQGVQPLFGVDFLPDNRLVSWGQPADYVDSEQTGSIVTWNLATGQADGPPFGPYMVSSGAVLSGGRSLLAVEGNGAVSQWDLFTRTSTDLASPGSADWVTVSANRRFATYTGPYGSFLLDTQSDERSRLPDGAHDVLATSPDGRTILAAGEHGSSVELWRREGRSGEFHQVHVGRRHLSTVLDGRWSADGTKIVTCGDDRNVVLWDAETLSAVDVFTGHSGRITACAFAPDGRTVYSAGLDGAVYGWDATTTRGLETLVRPGWIDGGFSSAYVTDDGNRLIAGIGDHVLTFDTATGQDMGEPLIFESRAVGLAANAGGDEFAAAFEDGRARAWSTHPDRAAAVDMQVPSSTSTAVALSGDGSVLALAVRRGAMAEAHLFDPHSGASLGDPLPLPNEALGLAISPNGRWLAAGTWTGKLVVFDLRKHRQVALLDANPTQYPVTVVRFSPDGRLVAAGGIHGRASLWRVDGWDLAWKASVGHNGYDLELTFSPDGEVLASSGTDSKTFLYEVDSGALIGSAFGPAANILTYSAYLPGRAEIIALGDEGSLRRWDLDPASWVTRACAIAGRDLTRVEWRELLPRREYQSTCPG